MGEQNPTTLIERVLCGGYPEAVARTTPRRRQAWTRQYLAMLLQRDVQDIAHLTKLDYVPKLLTALAHHAGQLCNFSQLAGQIGLDTKTAQSYTAVLEQIYLTRRLPVYSNNALSKLIKTPKIQFLDSGLLAQLLEISAISLIEHHQIFGHLLESFVYAELLKHISWSSDRYELSYYRDTAKNEVDFIIENARGELLAIEVKATVGVSAKDFAGLKKLQEWLPDKFKTGIVLYNGVQTLPFGQGLWAIPISTLWQCQLR